MKQIHFIIYTLIIVFAVFTTSCDKDDVAAPVISDLEIGYNNSLTGYLGSDLHFEATILAPGKIANIRIVIHPEGEDEHKSTLGIAHNEEWEVDTTYTGVYVNVKNTEFHEHIDVPGNAVAGDYHFHIYVTDLEGNQTIEEAEISISAPVADGSLPTVTVTSAPTQNQQFTTGTSISIAGTITDVQGIAGVYIGLVKEEQNLTDAQVNSSNTITLLHTHDFSDPKSYVFSASIKVGATTDNDITPKAINWTSGNYFIVVKTPAIDGEVGFSARYPVVISLN
jgi:hypothetical protein